MPVTVTSKNPTNNSVQLGWNSNPAANNDANVYISPNQSDLSNPPNFPPGVTSAAADQTGQLPGITDFTATINGLNSSTTYYLLCEADGVYSVYPDSFTTTGAAPAPITVQDSSVTVDSVAPLTLKFDWVGPDSPKGRLFLGTSPGSLAVAGDDPNAGSRHSYSVNTGLSFNQTYYYQLASLDSTGAVLSQGPVMAVTTPKAPSANTYLQAPVPVPGYPVPPRPFPFPFPPPHPPVIPLVTNPQIHPGGRSVITVETRDGNLPASNVLVEFKLSDPTMGKLGHGNLIGGDRVQLYSDPRMFESVVFISSGKIGTVTVGIKVVGGTHAHSTAAGVIQVS